MLRGILLAVVVAAICSACGPDDSSWAVRGIEFAALPGSGEPNLFATADGRVILTWLAPVEPEGHALRLAVRSGEGWSEPQTVIDRA